LWLGFGIETGLEGWALLQEVMGLVLASAMAAFIDIGVFVGAVLLLFGYINYRMAGAFVERITKSKKWQPVLGALLGVTPGCGGAIFLKPLFVRGSISFGAVIAALIATTGDSAFVMLATIPRQYVVVSAIAVVAAVFTGYLVDRTTLGPKLVASYAKRKADHGRRLQAAPGTGHQGLPGSDGDGGRLQHQGGNNQRARNLACFHRGCSGYWLLLGVGLVLGILGLFQVDVNALLIPNLGLVLGTAGTGLSISLMLAGRKCFGRNIHDEAEQNVASWQETLVHSARETSFVITWVFVGLLAYELVVLAIGGGNYAAGEQHIERLLLTAGLVSVVIGGLVGLIPGCGPQIIFVTLFIHGLIPFAALLANAASQDGDALFPLLALDRPSALWTSLITTIPALALGLFVYWLETRIGLLGWLGV
jgi:hypothetical protein